VRKASTAGWVRLARKRLSVEREGKQGLQALVKGFQRAFATDSISEEHSHKIDHLVLTATATGEAHALTNSIKDSLPAKMLDEQSDFAEPRRRRGHGLGRGLDDHRSIDDTSHVDLIP
jgi:hypothetical protein